MIDFLGAAGGSADAPLWAKVVSVPILLVVALVVRSGRNGG